MEIINHREFDKEYFAAKEQLYGTDIELLQDGDGIDTPMKVKIAIPGVMMEAEDAFTFAENLVKAENIAKEFKYNGYLLNWDD